ncbi:hypothetical protein MKW98_024292, partial [Papaver atlanticum]
APLFYKLQFLHNGEKLTLFYNPIAKGGFNQPIMCGGEPRSMLKKTCGKWNGPYKLQFEGPKAWRNKPLAFFNEGLAEELSRDGACERAIFLDSDIVPTRYRMIGNLNVEGVIELCNRMHRSNSPEYNPLANVDDGSCSPYSDSEE